MGKLKALACVAVVALISACTSGGNEQASNFTVSDFQGVEAISPAPCESILAPSGSIFVSVLSSCNSVDCGDGNFPLSDAWKLVDGDLDTYVSVVMDPSLSGRSVQFAVERFGTNLLPSGDQVAAFLGAPPQVELRLEGAHFLRATNEGVVVAEQGVSSAPGVQLDSEIWSESLASPEEFNGVALQINQQATLAPFELRVHELCINPYAS